MSNVDPGSFTSFGELLKYLRRRARLTQRQLGVAVGYSDAQITRMEKGQRLPDPAAVRARFLDVLDLQYEPALAQRLIELAEQAQAGEGARPVPLGNEDRSATAPLHTNLPAQLTRFIGREQDIAEVRHLLATHRLVTLTGAGGVGKTRLAIEVGTSLLGTVAQSTQPGAASRLAIHGPTFPDGVWLAELAAVSEPGLVPGVLARVFGLVPASRSAQEMVTNHLRGRCLLLILDNCEHLIDACAELAETLLHACPDLHVLTTSREALGIPAETTWRIPSLLPAEATQLFQDRAQAATSQFTLTAQNTGAVGRVCARLDGIPLAIELAAARVRTFSVEQIEGRLDDVFHLLTTGSRTALPRHQTLRALIDWSYDLLPEPERVLLRRLSVFAGGWTLEAAEAVASDAATTGMNAKPDGMGLEAADVAARLDQLVSKSLVSMDTPTASGGQPRYRMLEVVRQYAHEKLAQAGEVEPVRRRHLAYMCELTDEVNQERISPHPPAAGLYDRVQDEVGNVRAALEWALQSRDQPAGVRMVHNLRGFWCEMGYALEGLRWARDLLPGEDQGASPAVVADTHSIMGRLYYSLQVQDWEQAHKHFTIALPLAHQARDARLVQNILYYLSWTTPDTSKALEYARELLRIAPEQERPKWTAYLEFNLGHRARLAGDLTAASGHLHSAMEAACAQGDLYLMGQTSEKLGQLAMAQGDSAGARSLLERSLSISRQISAPGLDAENLTELGTLAERQGDTAAALKRLHECIPTFLKHGNLKPVCQCIAVAAGVALLRSECGHAVTLLSAADALWQSIPQGYYYKADYRFEYERLLPLVRAALPPAEFEQAWAEGQRMTLDQVIADVMATG